LVAHPALAGALGKGLPTDGICPSVSMGSFMRAAGADLTLFPSPYGKIGLPKLIAQKIALICNESWPAEIGATIPVPSAGIKPEHVSSACGDFGRDFILNAGTAIFASGRPVADSVKDFLVRLETFNDAR
jgi:2,3-diketo-5-methylthiopentyl-1-phosphate enolase